MINRSEVFLHGPARDAMFTLADNVFPDTDFGQLPEKISHIEQRDYDYDAVIVAPRVQSASSGGAAFGAAQDYLVQIDRSQCRLLGSSETKETLRWYRSTDESLEFPLDDAAALQHIVRYSYYVTRQTLGMNRQVESRLRAYASVLDLIDHKTAKDILVQPMVLGRTSRPDEDRVPRLWSPSTWRFTRSPEWKKSQDMLARAEDDIVPAQFIDIVGSLGQSALAQKLTSSFNR